MVEWWSAGLTKAGARLKALARFTCPNGVLSPIRYIQILGIVGFVVGQKVG